MMFLMVIFSHVLLAGRLGAWSAVVCWLADWTLMETRTIFTGAGGGGGSRSAACAAGHGQSSNSVILSML